jgi:hypothetical protein
LDVLAALLILRQVVLFILLTAALRIPLKLALLVVVLTVMFVPWSLLLLILLAKLVEGLHGGVLFVHAPPVLVHLLHQVELLRSQRLLEPPVDLHLLQLLRDAHEPRVRIHLLEPLVLHLLRRLLSPCLMIMRFLHY